MKNYFFVPQNNLLQYNSLRIESYGNIAFPTNRTGVYELFEDFSTKKYQICFLGNGSNVLFTKESYDDSFLFVSTKLLDKITLQDDTFKAECGVCLSDIAFFAAENRIKGFAFLEDIPGSIGGACIMNAGTYDNNISDLILKIEFYDSKDQTIKTINNDSTLFGKRYCRIAEGNNLILSCDLKADYSEDKDFTISEINKIFDIKITRYKKQPREYPSAGSVFVRPPLLNGHQYYVWELLEKAGLKGYSIGGAQISEKHPGFIINKSNGKPRDFLDLIHLCKERVYNQFGIELQLEWKLI